jgi:hypothetical protein
MQPDELSGQRMGSGHNMKEIRRQVGVEKNDFLCTQLPEMMPIYGHINASLCAADIPISLPML